MKSVPDLLQCVEARELRRKLGTVQVFSLGSGIGSRWNWGIDGAGGAAIEIKTSRSS